MPLPQNRNREGVGGLIPPPAQPVRRFTTPSIGDGFYAERVDVSARDYVPLKRGTPYSTIKDAKQSVIDQFPNLYFLKETLDPFFYPWAMRLWATDEDAESSYNAEVTYLNENVDYPSYSRIYTVRREEYEANPTLGIGTPLTGIVAVRIDSPGSGYTKDDVVSFDSGDAEAELVVDSDGAIVAVVVKAEGDGYDSASLPAVSITSATGSGAALSAIMQDKTAVLTSQKKIELADDDPLSQEKVRIIRIYETLPGPFDYSTRLDPDGVVVAIATRRNIAADIESGSSISGGIWYKRTKKGDLNSYVADEIVETRGIPGNAIPAVLVGDDLYGSYTSRTLYYSDYIEPEVSEYGGVLTTVEKKDVSESISEQIRRTKKWLDDASYAITIPNVIPEEFMALIPTTTISHKVVGVATQPSLGTNEFARAEKQLDAVFKRVTVETLGEISLPITHITERETNDFGGGILNIIRTLASGLQDADEGFNVFYSDVKDLGNGLSYKETHEFQLTAGAFPSVPSAQIGADAYIAYIYSEIKAPEDISPEVSESGGVLTTVEEEPLTWFRSTEKVTTKTWLDDADYSVTIPNVIPMEFRALIPTKVVAHRVVGTASQPSLGSSEFARAEKQLDKIFKRVTVESLSDVAVPIVHVTEMETNEFGGGIMNVIRTLDAGVQDADEGFNVFYSKVEDLGNGFSFKETHEFQLTAGDFPSIPSAQVMADMYVAQIYTQIKEPADIAPEASEAGGVLTTVEEEPLTWFRSVEKTSTKNWVDDADYSVTIPNVIPMEFRALIATTTVAHKVAGIASQPSLGTGEFARAEKQLDKLFKRVTVESLGDISVPITHTTEMETNDFGGGIMNVIRTLDAGLQDADEGFNVFYSKVEDLGNGLSYKETHEFQLTGGDFPSVPSALLGADMYVAQIYTQIKEPADIAPESSESGGVLTTVEEEPLTWFRSVEKSTTKNWVDDADYSITIPNVIPMEFRALIPTRVVAHRVAGIASQPSLGTGEFAHAEKQIDKIFKRVTIESLADISVPITHTTEMETNDFGGGILNIIRTLDSGVQDADEGFNVFYSKVEDLGNGLSFKETHEFQLTGGEFPSVPSALVASDMYVAEIYTQIKEPADITPAATESGGVLTTVEEEPLTWFRSTEKTSTKNWVDDADFSITIPNVIPMEFRALIPTTVVAHKVAGIASQPSLGTGEFARSEKQLDKIFKRVTVESIGDVAVPITHTTEMETNEYGGGIMSIIRTLDAGVQDAEEGFDIFYSKVEDLGNGLSFRETHQFQLTAGAFPAIPWAQIAQDGETEEGTSEIKAPGSITPGLTESGGVLTKTEQEPLTSFRSVEKASTRTWVDDADYSITIPNVIPQWARALIPTTTVGHKVAGTASQPSLGVGEFARAEKQIDKIFKRVTVESLNFGSLPLVLTNRGLTEKFGGSATTITVTLATENTLSQNQGLTVLDSRVDKLGNGMEVRTTEEADVGAWYYLYGQEYDEGLDVLIPFLERTIPAQSQQGQAHTDIKPQDIWRSRLRSIDTAAAEAVLGAYLMQYPSKTNINMPDKLVSLTGSIESKTGNAADSEFGTSTGYGSYSINLDLRADATASAVIIPEIVAEIKQFYGANIDCTHFIFFLPNPVTSADVLAKINELLGESVAAWPKFNPQTLTMLIIGGDAYLKVNAVSKGSYSQSADLSSQSMTSGGGTGQSKARGMTVRRYEISPTIHEALVVGGVTDDTVDLNAYCASEAVGLGPAEYVSETDTIDAFTLPTSFDATDGDTDWPTAGKFLYRVDARPYKYGFVMFHVIVVDAADFPTNV